MAGTGGNAGSLGATALLVATDDAARSVLSSPGVGIFRDGPAPGSLIRPGSYLGQLEVLGALHRLYAPRGAHGIATLPPGAEDAGRLRPVGYGDPLVVLDRAQLSADTSAGQLADTRSGDSALGAGELVFRAPMSGRFYLRPAPDKPPFVRAGDEIAAGATVGLLEVMKTFNRVTYGGDELPERAVIVEIVPEDQADLAADDIILRMRRP